MRLMWGIIFLAFAVVVTTVTSAATTGLKNKGKKGPQNIKVKREQKRESSNCTNSEVEALRAENEKLRKKLHIKERALMRFMDRTLKGVMRNQKWVAKYESSLDEMMYQMDDGNFTMEQIQNDIAPRLMECKREMTDFHAMMKATKDFQIFMGEIVFDNCSDKNNPSSGWPTGVDSNCMNDVDALISCRIMTGDAKYIYDACVNITLRQNVAEKFHTCVSLGRATFKLDADIF